MDAEHPKWELAGDWKGSVFTHQAVQLSDGKVLVLRDGSRGKPQAALWWPATGFVAELAPPAARVYKSSLTALPDGRALHVAPTTEVFSLADHKWTEVEGPPGATGSDHATVLLSDGRILVTGGTLEPRYRLARRIVVESLLAGATVLGALVGAVLAVREYKPSAAQLAVAISSACTAAGSIAGALYVLSQLARGMAG
jgi:hypothetical protein